MSTTHSSEEVVVYRCILVPLDGSPFGEQSLPLAVEIARRSGAVLQLAHVHLPPIIPSGAETAALPPVWIEMSWDEKKGYLDDVASRLVFASGVKVETRVMEGAVTAALEHHAVRCGAGLIVMSTHGHVGMSRLWHHGVADQLARDLPLPVLLVRPDDSSPPPTDVQADSLSHILLPLTDSGYSARIIEHAVRLGQPFDARFTLVKVIPGGRQGVQEETARAMGASSAAARQYLNSLAERLRTRGVEVATEVLVGHDAPAALLGRIHGEGRQPEDRADLVAIESPERGVMSRLLVRDLADELIEHASIPVLLYRAPRSAVASTVAEPGLVGSG